MFNFSNWSGQAIIQSFSGLTIIGVVCYLISVNNVCRWLLTFNVILIQKAAKQNFKPKVSFVIKCALFFLDVHVPHSTFTNRYQLLPVICAASLFQVTGSKNEDQVLNAIEAYTEFRPELAHRAINQLFDIARIQHCSHLLRALQVWCVLFFDGGDSTVWV